MNIIKKIPGICLNVIMVIVFIIMLIAGYCFLQINVFDKDYINLFGFSFFQIRTGSMEPELKVGDVIIVDLLDSNEILKEEEIISYIEEDKIITHRIIEINDKNIIAKGDANNANDEPIEKSQVIGKIIRVIPNVSIWMNVLKTPEVYTMLLITLGLFVITFSINTEDKNENSLNKKTEAEIVGENDEEKKK